MEIKEHIEVTAKECAKSQMVRLIDVFFIAPVLVYAGIEYRKVLPQWLSVTLVVLGGATFHYNAKNYFETQRLNQKKP